MHSIRLHAVIAGLALGATACLSPTSSDCTDAGLLTESRGSHVDGSGVVLATATMQVSEDRPNTPSVIVLGLFGPSAQVAGPLRGHVTAVRVVGAAGQVVFAPATLDQIPASETGGGALVRGIVLARGDDATSAATRMKLVNNDLTVELETDYPGAELLRFPLRLVSSERVRLCLA